MGDELGHPYYLRDPYREFLATEGIPVVEGFAVDCLKLQLEPWARLGGSGAYVHLAGRGEYVSCYVAEIPAMGKLEPEKHLHDEVIHVLQGRGATVVEMPDGRRHTFEWGPGSLFAIPLNCAHQLYNLSGTEPARFAALTNLPIILNLFHNLDFIYANPCVFPERGGEERYFHAEGELRLVKPGRHQWETNFVADLTSFTLQDWKERGAGGTSIQFCLADSTMHAHISEFGVGTYKKAHRHAAGAHIFCVTGHGYSLLWKDNDNPVDTVRIDWQPGTLYAPPDDHYHQHFNTANQPSRYLAVGIGGVRYPLLESKRVSYEAMDKSQDEGGNQVEYENEDPRIRVLYESELAEEGIESRMAAYAPAR
jgi:oxalate decarboxylase/phosphoglucose isomerase-like protein (cupin superfamily)